MEISKIESYSFLLSEKISDEVYRKKSSLTGDDILKLTPLAQINLFIIKNLFENWKEEMARLKSPYFSYESEDIKESLQILGNKLSRNILIKKDDFTPLLTRSIKDTLILIFYPQQFFIREFSKRNVINLIDFKETEKYYKINKAFFIAIVKELESMKIDVVPQQESERFLNKVFYNNHFQQEDPVPYVEVFSSMLQIDLSQPKAQNTYKVKPPDEPSISENRILNEKFGGEQTTLNDFLKQVKSETLADRIGKEKVSNLKGSFSLNQKFLFINSLFKGAGGEFENAINEIETTGTYEEALNILKENYATRFNWNLEHEEVKEFLNIVERKFNN